MSGAEKNYEMVIGLEVHVELKTESKIFCACPTTFGAEPNTHCCPVCMGMPGTLPVLNGQVVEFAIIAGLATNCTIPRVSIQDRKNYFYPDLPKAYQISQNDRPLCAGGWLDIESEKGKRRIGITRIHIEEDAGKLIHKDQEDGGTLIDLNRGGMPLIEIVSVPDLRSADEVKAYLQKLRAIMLYIGVSDCKMNEGSFRCDVNLSIRKKGENKMGTRTEMKNLNSFQFIGKAIEYEFSRQVAAVEAGETIVQETRRYDQSTGKTDSMSEKADAADYRYFPDPDLPPIVVSEETLKALRQRIPTLPDERKAAYMERWGLTAYDAEMLVIEKEISDFFEQAAPDAKDVKLLTNLILSELYKRYDPDQGGILIRPNHMAELANMLAEGRINSGTARQVFVAMWDSGAHPGIYVHANKLEQLSDRNTLTALADEVIAANPKMVADYRSGKKKALQAMIGQVMGRTKGQGNPVIIKEVFEQQLAKE